MFELRPYQAEAKRAILSEWDQGRRKTLLVLPTGCGKTVVFASVTETQVSKGHRVLIMAHRGELLEQAADKLRNAYGLVSILEKADSTSLGSPIPVVVGSVQSLMQEKRLAKFPENYFNDIIVDEAHHCLSDSYLKVLNHFPQANILGVTATPDRGDQKNLGNFFDSKAYEYSMAEAIKAGYLSPIRAQLIPLELDIGDVRISQGDYSAGDVGHALDPYLHQIAEEMAHYCQGRRTVVFLPLIETSQKFCAILNSIGLRAAEVNGTSEDRGKILEAFSNGEFDVLCNSMLLTEGWDCPSVDCVVILRPTKVRSLYQQMVGRGMRLPPGKKELLLLDFLWNTARHDLCKPPSLISKDEAIAQKIEQQLRKKEDGVDLIVAEREAERDIVAEREEALAKQLAAQRGKKKKLVDPLQYAFSIDAEDLIDYDPTFTWEMGPPTEKQIAYLEKCGISTAAILNAGMASQLISKVKRRQELNLSTPKQIRMLENRGFRHVGTWTKEEASYMIGLIAENNWKIPRGIIPPRYTPRRLVDG